MGRVSIEPGIRTIEVPDEVEKKILDLHRQIRELPREVAEKIVERIGRNVMLQLEYVDNVKTARHKLKHYFSGGYALNDALEATKKKV